MVENRTVVEQRIKISWHPHHPIYQLWLCECQNKRAPAYRERMYSGVVLWTGSYRDAVVTLRQSERLQEFSKEAEGRPKGAMERRKRDRDAQMDRQYTQESSQMLRTERSIRSVSKDRMIVLFNSSTIQRDCHFVEEFFNFERWMNNDQSQRSTSEERRETETDSRN